MHWHPVDSLEGATEACDTPSIYVAASASSYFLLATVALLCNARAIPDGTDQITSYDTFVKMGEGYFAPSTTGSPAIPDHRL